MLTVIASMQAGSVQGVFLWLAALTQGEHANPANIGVLFPKDPYNLGVSGPNKTNVFKGVIEEKCPGPESLVTIKLDTRYSMGICSNFNCPA